MDVNTAKCVWPTVVGLGVLFLGMFVLPGFFKHGVEKTPVPISLQPYVDPKMDVEPKGAAGGIIFTLMLLAMAVGSIWGIGLILKLW